MKRQEFFKKIIIGAAAMTVAPKVLAEQKTEPTGIILCPNNLSPQQQQTFIDEWRKENGQIIYKSKDNTVWLEIKEDGRMVIHCPGEIIATEHFELPENINMIAFSNVKL